MIIVAEAQSAACVTHELAFDAMRRAFIAAIGAEAFSFPVVVAHGSDPQNRFTIKSAAGADLAGLKVGAYFPSNDARGLRRHASTILLIDQSSGRIGAVVEGSTLNCYRTAAADAVATDALARPDAAVLTLFGTGHQAGYEAQAIARKKINAPAQCASKSQTSRKFVQVAGGSRFGPVNCNVFAAITSDAPTLCAAMIYARQGRAIDTDMTASSNRANIAMIQIATRAASKPTTTPPRRKMGNRANAVCKDGSSTPAMTNSMNQAAKAMAAVPNHPPYAASSGQA